MAMRQRHLGAPEAQILHRIGGRSGAVKADLFVAFAADQVVDRLVAQLADQIPER